MDFLLDLLIVLPLALVCYLFGLLYNAIQIRKQRPFIEAFLRSSFVILLIFAVSAIPFFLAIIFSADLAPMYTATGDLRTEYILSGVLGTLGLFPFVAIPFYAAMYRKYRKSESQDDTDGTLQASI